MFLCLQMVEELSADKAQLIGALEEVQWSNEREELLQRLEEALDKTSTWQEEKEELQSQLTATEQNVKNLVRERQDLIKAASEAAWNSDREHLLEALLQEKDRVGYGAVHPWPVFHILVGCFERC